MSKRSLKSNTFYAGITNLSDILIFLLMIIAGRFLGTKDFGIFSFAQSLAIVFFTFSNFGLNSLLIRDVSRNKNLAFRYLGNIVSWKAFLSAIAFLMLYVTIGYFYDSDKNNKIVTSIVAIAVMIRYFGMTGRAILQSIERFDLEAIAVFSEQTVLLVVGAAVLYLGYGLVVLAFIFFFARSIGFLIIFVILTKIIYFKPLFEFRFMYDLQITAVPIGIALVIVTAYLQVDTLILSKMQSYAEVGLYNAAFKIYSGMFLLPSIISTVLFPRLSESFVKDKKQQNILLTRGMLCLFLISLPLSVVGIFFSEEIILLAFGEKFLGAVDVMMILFGVTTITFQLWLLRIFLLSINMQNALMKLYLLGLCSRIILDMLLIPKYSIVGAAIASGISESLLFICIWLLLLFKHFKIKMWNVFPETR